MRRILSLFFVSVFLLALSPKKIAEIEKKVQEEGKLRFRHPPKVILVKKKEFFAMLMGKRSKESMILEALGIIDDARDYDMLKVNMMVRSAVGFFNPEEGDRIYLIEGLPPFEQEFALVHELRHYIQSQNFPDVFKSVVDGSLCDDRTISASAVLEGDANLVTLIYFDINEFPMDFSMLKLPDNKNGRFLREIYSFMYGEGYKIVKEHYDKEGWKGVFYLLKHPPEHTSIFFEKPYIVPDCSCSFPLVLGMKVYSLLLGNIAEDLTGDCICINNGKFHGELVFKGVGSAIIAYKRISGKIKSERFDNVIKIKGRIKNDSSHPGEERNNP